MKNPPILKWIDGIDLHPLTEDGPGGATRWAYQGDRISVTVDSWHVDFTHGAHQRFGATVTVCGSMFASRRAADPQTALDLAMGEAAWRAERLRTTLDRFATVVPVPPEPRGL